MTSTDDFPSEFDRSEAGRIVLKTWYWEGGCRLGGIARAFGFELDFMGWEIGAGRVEDQNEAVEASVYLLEDGAFVTAVDLRPRAAPAERNREPTPVLRAAGHQRWSEAVRWLYAFTPLPVAADRAVGLAEQALRGSGRMEERPALGGSM